MAAAVDFVDGRVDSRRRDFAAISGAAEFVPESVDFVAESVDFVRNVVAFAGERRIARATLGTAIAAAGVRVAAAIGRVDPAAPILDAGSERHVGFVVDGRRREVAERVTRIAEGFETFGRQGRLNGAPFVDGARVSNARSIRRRCPRLSFAAE